MSTELQKELIKIDLNPKQKIFCKLYASSEEFFGNGVRSYMKAYDSQNYKASMVCAWELLRNPKISQYISQLLELRGLNDNFVDKQLEFLITQHTDFKSKLGAIHEYNQLKKRAEVNKNKTQINVVVLPAELMNKHNIKGDII